MENKHQAANSWKIKIILFIQDLFWLHSKSALSYTIACVTNE